MRKVERQSISLPLREARRPKPQARGQQPEFPTEIRTIDGVKRRVTICPAGVAEGAFTSAAYWRRTISRYAQPMKLDDAAAVFAVPSGRSLLKRYRTPAGRFAEAETE